VAQLDKEYIQTAKLKYVVREYPLEQIHPLAFKASEAARCASDQGKYFEYHDLLFANQKALTPLDLANHAKAIGLDLVSFQECFDSGKYTATVRRDVETGQKAGIRGTPTFLVGVQDGDKVKVSRIIRGAQPFSVIKDVLDKQLAQN